MRILITGANGFIGRQLVAKLLADPPAALAQFSELVLLDLRFANRAHDPRVHYFETDLGNPTAFEEAFRKPFDLIFHLASIAGGAAEEKFELGKQVNLDSTLRLLEACRAQSQPPIFVYSSSIGVYGELPAVVTDDTPARPNWTYGTHKLIGELLTIDYARRGWVDARILRFPGIVARPRDPSGALSAFMSDLIRDVSEGKHFLSPVSAGALSWWMSVGCCVDNVLHAATLSPAILTPIPFNQRVWTLPPLRASMEQVISGLERVFGIPAREFVTYAPQPEIEERFGKLPEASFQRSEAMGFHHDGSVDALVRRALVTEKSIEVLQ